MSARVSGRRAAVAWGTGLALVLGSGVASAPAMAATPGPAAAAEEASTGKVLYQEDFEAGMPEDFLVAEGPWTIENGRLVGSAPNGQQSRVTFGEHYRNFRFEATVRFENVVNSARWQALGLDMPVDGSEPWSHAAMRSETTATNGIEFARRVGGGWNVTDTASAPANAGVGKDVRVAIEVQGSTGRWFFDDELVLETNKIARTSDGVLGFVVNGATVSYDDILVTELEPLPAFRTVAPGETGIVIAHRGASAIAPENTMPAYVSAVRGGAHMIETDIHMTKDNIPVVMHDATVNRTTNGTGAIADMTYEEFRQLDAGSWFDPSFAGTKAPSLEELLTYVRNSGTILLLEYKSVFTDEQAKITTDMIARIGVEDQVFVQSFDEGTLQAVRRQGTTLPLGFLTGDIPANPVQWAKERGYVAINPTGAGALKNPERVQELDAAGLGVFTWTIDNASDWAKLTQLGVEGIITNKPDQLIGWIAKYNAGGGEELPVGENEQRIRVNVPKGAVQPSGAFTWRFASTGLVDLGQATQLGDGLVAQGSINPILVTDTRRTPSAPWQLSAQASEFRDAKAGEAFSSAHLGWTPRLIQEGAGAVAGDKVAPDGNDEKGGLASLALLGEGTGDEFKGTETAQLGASLELRLPLDVTPGDYRSTMTITVVQ